MTHVTPRTLTVLAEEIRRESQAAEGAFQSAVEHAICAGRALAEAKAQLRHGQWLPWLKDNFPLSERTARNYMKLAEKSATVADLPTVREAIAALAEPKTPDVETCLRNAISELRTAHKLLPDVLARSDVQSLQDLRDQAQEVRDAAKALVETREGLESQTAVGLDERWHRPGKLG